MEEEQKNVLIQEVQAVTALLDVNEHNIVETSSDFKAIDICIFFIESLITEKYIDLEISSLR